MKVAQISKYGGGEVVEINEVPKPGIDKGKLLVKVHTAGVNPIDWKIRQGYLQQMAPLQFPATLGGDFSGIVVEVGEGVSDFKKGDNVYGTAIILAGGSGSFAEFASTSPALIALKPKNVNHMEAAALPLPGVSAWQALVEHMALSQGKKILIHGGAGGIGTFAIQIAKHLGAYVAATASVNDLAYAKQLGADEVMDYKNQSFEKLISGYDAVFDTVGGETYAKSFEVLKKGGIIVSMLEQPNQQLMKQYGVNAIAQGTQINTVRLSKLTELVEHGIVKAHIDKIFPLNKAGEALEYLQKGHPRGKVVLEI